MRKFFVVSVGVAVLAILGFGLVVAEESEESLCIPMGEIILEPPAQVEAKRSAVMFPHSTHFDYTCKTCHHKWDGESPVLSCMTTDCHDAAINPRLASDSRAETEPAVRYFKTAFHSSCIGCHKEIKRRNKQIEDAYRTVTEPIKRSGPTGCSECHPKE